MNAALTTITVTLSIRFTVVVNPRHHKRLGITQAYEHLCYTLRAHSALGVLTHNDHRLGLRSPFETVVRAEIKFVEEPNTKPACSQRIDHFR